MPPIKLTDLTPGEPGVVFKMPAEHKDGLRLRELGMNVGSKVEVIRLFNGTPAIKLRGIRYAIAPEITDLVMVEQIKTTSAAISSMQ